MTAVATSSAPRGRRLSVDAVLVQAVIAGALSFAHLHDLAEAAGQTGWKAWAYPVSVDLLLVAAWRRLRLQQASGGAVRAAWTWFTVALAASLGANVATAGLLDLTDVPAWLRILVAGWPALAFLGGTLLAHTPAVPAAPEMTVPQEPEEPRTGPVGDDAKDDAPAPAVPELTSRTETAPRPEPAPVPVPPPLLDHARKVADAHRARTGEPIDTDTLRVRLGVPEHLAEAVAAHLT